MRVHFKKLIQLIQMPEEQSSRFRTFWIGAFWGLLLFVGTITFLSGFFFRTGIPKVVIGIGMLLLGILAFWIFRLLTAWLHKGILLVPTYVFSLISGTLISIFIAKEIRFRFADILFYPGVLVFSFFI